MPICAARERLNYDLFDFYDFWDVHFSRGATEYSQPRVERACERNPGLTLRFNSHSPGGTEYIALNRANNFFRFRYPGFRFTSPWAPGTSWLRQCRAGSTDLRGNFKKYSESLDFANFIAYVRRDYDEHPFAF